MHPARLREAETPCQADSPGSGGLLAAISADSAQPQACGREPFGGARSGWRTDAGGCAAATAVITAPLFARTQLARSPRPPPPAARGAPAGTLARVSQWRTALTRRRCLAGHAYGRCQQRPVCCRHGLNGPACCPSAWLQSLGRRTPAVLQPVQGRYWAECRRIWSWSRRLWKRVCQYDAVYLHCGYTPPTARGRARRSGRTRGSARTS